ncbi:MAG: SsrA-binding protein SmpB [Bacteroidaceae bacterium]|nr:SsrA-binding protein SmpB [Bacteroidaceae bacterium]MBR4782354.1 SsrA-binding protein SmpB [Bacteroidaceae bacterium]
MANKKNDIKSSVIIKNRKAEFDYFFLSRFTAGIVLTGTEIKSIRQSRASLVDTYCYVSGREVWVKNMYIAEYFYGSFNNHNIRRDRKLLLNRREITRIEQQLKNPGLTVVPTQLYINEQGRAKLEIALARGKKMYDKRATMKDRDDQREMERATKNHPY